MRSRDLTAILSLAGILAGGYGLISHASPQEQPGRTRVIRTVGPADQLVLPKPYETPSAHNRPKVVGWPEGRTPTPAPGFQVSVFAAGFKIPRQLYVLPNGDVVVAESGISGRF